MIRKFQQLLKTQKLLDSQKKVLLAVSGGVDSIVLFSLMQQLPQAQRPQLTIAHVNHQLRAASDQEEQFVKALAEQADVPFYSYHWSKQEQPETGIEEAARVVRYTFFKNIMQDQGIDYLMTGHHLDDQVETVLMRLTRGASLKQLLGIRLHQRLKLENSDGHLMRPLLHFSKEELYQYAQEHKLTFVEDATNQETDFTRNRFRNEIIPLLKEENERFNEHVAQFTGDLADRLAIAEVPIQEAYKKAVHTKQARFYLNLAQFNNYVPAMQRAVITQILEELYADEAERYKANYIELVQNWLDEGTVNTTLDLIGSYQVQKGYTEAVFMKKDTEDKTISTMAAPRSFTIDTVNEWVQLSANEAMGLFTIDQPADDELVIAADNLYLPLRIRHRQPGDRMTYKGLQGSKKVSDIFIDDKTPPKAREQAWIVEDQQGTIIWLVDHRKMHLFTETETDKMLYSLKYVKN